MKNVVILGSGTGGTIVANALSRKLSKKDWQITVVDKNVLHYYQPGFLFVAFQMNKPGQVVKKKPSLLSKGINFVLAEIDYLNPEANTVQLKNGQKLTYDFLVIATGVDIEPRETPGLLDAWNDSAFDFYTLEGSVRLAEKIPTFSGGRLVIHVAEMPIKCPVAPLEFAFLSDWYFRRKKIRSGVNLTLVTPLPGAFTKSVASRMLGDLLVARNIRIEPDFVTEKVDASSKKIVSFDGREVYFDLLVSVPTNMGAEFIERSGLGDELRLVPADHHTLRAKNHENIFVVGDAANLPSSKAGATAHFQSETLVGNIIRAIEGKALEPSFDGHANCFIETGFKKAVLIDFNYQVEPLPGLFPFPIVGPMPLLKPSRINHSGKLLFRHVYWKWLLSGRPIPFIRSQMKMAGKRAG